jgi:cobalamin synthase
MLGWGAVPLGISALYPALSIGFLLSASFSMWARQRVDGVGGDMHEADIALTETCRLLFAAIAID